MLLYPTKEYWEQLKEYWDIIAPIILHASHFNKKCGEKSGSYITRVVKNIFFKLQEFFFPSES